jgi:ABC-2 type transport system permease protein
LIIMTTLPLVVMAFLEDALRPVDLQTNVLEVTGADQAVPGMAVMFSFFLVNSVAFNFFREHGWNTWDRLRTSRATSAEIIAGLTTVPFGAVVAQQAILVLGGGWLFGLTVRGSYAALALVIVALALCVVTLGLALVGACRTIVQLDTYATVGTMMIAGLGGALAPQSTLPAWARVVAPGVPSYWAMRAYHEVILGAAGVTDVMPLVAVLAGFSLVFASLARAFLRFDDKKIRFV